MCFCYLKSGASGLKLYSVDFPRRSRRERNRKFRGNGELHGLFLEVPDDGGRLCDRLDGRDKEDVWYSYSLIRRRLVPKIKVA